MPIVQAYKGKITVEGATYGGPKDENGRDIPFYSNTVVAYGETPGELIDALVEASVKVANDVFEWCLANKPADYKMKGINENWYIQMAHPEYLLADPNDPSTFSEREDTGGGGSVDSVEAIVRYAVLSRDIEIKHAVIHFSLSNPGGQRPTAIPQEPAVSYNGCYDAESLQETTKFGWTGKEYDNIIAIAKEEGRLDAYRAGRKTARAQHERSRQARVAQAKVENTKSRIARWFSGEVR